MLALLALVGLLFLGLALILPGMLSSPALRAQLEESASRLLGGRVRYEGISVGLLPPALQVAGIRLSSPEEAEEALFAAEQLSLQLDLGSLLSGRLQLGVLQLRGVQLQLVRDAGGFRLPFPTPSGVPEETTEQPPRRGEAPPAGGADAAFPVALALREIEIPGARIRLEDRTLDPPERWDLLVDAGASLDTLERPVEVFADVQAPAGGRLRAKGWLTPAGPSELDVEIDALELASFSAYLAPRGSLQGLLSGVVRMDGPIREPENLRADLRVVDAVLLRTDIGLAGDFSGQLELRQPLGQPQGHFEIDATSSSIRYAGLFEKSPGVPAGVSGRIVAESEGRLGVEDLELKLRDLEARGAWRSGPNSSLELRAAPFDLEGWGSLLPGLAPLALEGSVALQELRVDVEPWALYGNLGLRNVSVRLPERPPVVVSGEIALEGDVLRSRGARIHLAQQPLDLELSVEDLFGQRRFRSRVRAEALDSGALAQALGDPWSDLSGPLSVKGDMSGRIGSGGGIAETLSGRLDFEIEDGSLAGVSLLQAAFEQMGAAGPLGILAVEAGRIFGGRDLQRFYGERFERLEGRLVVEGGSAHLEPLRLIYRDYGAELRGGVDLSDLSLDAQGVLTLYEPIDAVIARKAGAPSGYTPARRQVPLAAVKGYLDAPRVRLDAQQVGAFLASYASDVYGDRLGEMLERKLGPGAGNVVDQGLQVLQGILGGGRSQRSPPDNR